MLQIRDYARAIVVCALNSSSLGLLVRLSGSSDFWPENRNRVIPCLSGFKWKLVLKAPSQGCLVAQLVGRALLVSTPVVIFWL